MPDWLRDWWVSLSGTQRTLVIALVGVLVIGVVGFVLGTFAFMGTDYSGFGSWMQGWR